MTPNYTNSLYNVEHIEYEGKDGKIIVYCLYPEKCEINHEDDGIQ